MAEGVGQIETVVAASPEEGDERHSIQRIALFLEPERLPRLEITDAFGVTRHKTVGLADLLTVLDHSAVLEAIRHSADRVTEIPELPERTMFAGVRETPREIHVVVTGWLPPREQPFVWQDRSYLIALPLVAWSARWNEAERRLDGLQVAVAEPGVEEARADTPLYRWPFANVYASGTYAEVCWYTMRRVELDLRDVVRLGVEGFLSVRDNGDLFGVGNSQNSPHRDYAEFLEAVEALPGGVPTDWLIPHQVAGGQPMTVEKFHEANL